jgi:hypothetical protein
VVLNESKKGPEERRLGGVRTFDGPAKLRR